MAVWRVSITMAANGNRSAAVQGDKLPITQTYNGCVIVLVVYRSHWETLGWLGCDIDGMSRCVSMSVYDTTRLWRQVLSSFPCCAPVIFPSFRFFHMLSFDETTTIWIIVLQCFHSFTLSKLSRVPDSFSAGSPPRLFLLLAPARSSPSPPLCVDIYSNSMTGLSGGRRC